MMRVAGIRKVSGLAGSCLISTAKVRRGTTSGQSEKRAKEPRRGDTRTAMRKAGPPAARWSTPLGRQVQRILSEGAREVGIVGLLHGQGGFKRTPGSSRA